VKIGCLLSCEEFGPLEMISDHYHSWAKAQGQSPFVWSEIEVLSPR